MINGIQGKPGGGKSYEAVVRHIIPTVVKDKRKVITNLPLQIDHFCNVYGDFCRDLIQVVDGDFHNFGGQRPFSKVEHFLQYENWENEQGQKVLFVIDEAHLAMPKGATDKKLLEFLSMHRHYGFDIILITQTFRKLHPDVRDMITIGYRAIKKSMIGQDDKYILKVHDGASASASSCVNTFEREYQKKYFRFYQSHTKSSKSVQESTTKDVPKWFKHWSILTSLPVLIIGALIIIGKLNTLDTDTKLKDTQNKIKSVTNRNNENRSLDNLNSVSSNHDTDSGISDSLNLRQREYYEMVKKSKTYHPFYKVKMSIAGFGDYMDSGHRVKKYYIAAIQNGQRVFTISTQDLMQAGYDVFVMSDCAIRIQYYDYKDYLTCNAPTQQVQLQNSDLVASN